MRREEEEGGVRASEELPVEEREEGEGGGGTGWQCLRRHGSSDCQEGSMVESNERKVEEVEGLHR